MENVILNGVSVLRDEVNRTTVHYHFFSYSSNQIKSRTCVMYAGTIQDIESVLNNYGKFDKISNISKRAARIGLLFSTCFPTIEITVKWSKTIEDITHDGR